MRTFNRYDTADFVDFISSVPVNRRITNVQIHHTVIPTLQQYNDAADKEAIIRGMWRYHTVERGFRDIAQHFTIAPDGVWDGRDLEWDSGGFLGFENEGGICIEMIGNYDIGGEKFGYPLAEVAYRAVAAILDRWPDADIRFHRDQPSARGKKTCPGTSIEKQTFVSEVRVRRRPESPVAVVSEFVAGHGLPELSIRYWEALCDASPSTTGELFRRIAEAIHRSRR